MSRYNLFKWVASRGGLMNMVSALDSRSSALGARPGRVLVVLLGKTLVSHSASLQPLI